MGVFTKRPSDKKRWEEEERGREMSCRRLVGGTSCGICPKGDVMAVPKVHLRPADILCWRPRRHGRAFLAPRRCHWHQCRPDLGMSPRRSAFLISWLMTRTLIRSLSQLISCLLIAYPLESLFVRVPSTQPALRSIFVAILFFFPILQIYSAFFQLLASILTTYFIAKYNKCRGSSLCKPHSLNYFTGLLTPFHQHCHGPFNSQERGVASLWSD